jgi:hypothetical protein
MSIPLLDKDKWPIDRQCRFAGEIYDTFFYGIAVATLKHEGPKVLGTVWGTMIRKHQRKYFLQGLAKLGLDKEAPAVACAKYHYLSNIVGGLKMEYIEESSKKAWVRYVSPWWHGAEAELIIPVEADLAVFEGWHGNNWKSLKSPGLAFVLTKICSAGDPYYEGYWEEFERELHSEERFQYRPGVIGPDFDPSKAPRLDPNEWPPIRLAKARRNYSREYAADGTRALLEVVGTTRAAAILEDMYRQLGIHFTERWFKQFELPDNSAKSIAAFFKLFGELLGEDGLIRKLNEKKFAFGQTGSKLFPEFDVPSQIFRSMSAFHDSAAKRLNQRVDVTFSVDVRNKGLEWTIEEFDRRLI